MNIKHLIIIIKRNKMCDISLAIQSSQPLKSSPQVGGGV